MPAKILALTQKDQDLLRVALERATTEWTGFVKEYGETPDDRAMTERIKDLKERLV